MTIDFHSHILPHMDDGSKSAEMSLEMLRQMRASGTDAVVATPHYYRRREDIDAFLQRREASFQRLQPHLTDEYPQIYPGAEVAFYFGIERDRALHELCICGTDTLLIELPFAAWSDYEYNALASLCYDCGITVVLAHYERFAKLQTRDLWTRILELPVYVQINADSLLPTFSGGKWVKMFARQEAQLLGSDCHDLSKRPPNLGKGRRRLETRLGSAVLAYIDARAEALLSPAQKRGKYQRT